MARTVKAIGGDDAVPYVMELGGEREAYVNGTVDNPMTVWLLPMSARDVDKMERSLGKFTRGQEVNIVTKGQQARDRILIERVERVENYAIEASDTGEVLIPKNGSDLVKMLPRAAGGEYDLVFTEIERALKDHSYLADGLRERLRSQSVSSTPETPKSSAGVASDAGGPTQ